MTPHTVRQRSSPARLSTPAISPAARLVIAILHQAATDYAAGSPRAAAFIRGRTFDFYCDLINANPDYLRRRIIHDLTQTKETP